MPKQAVSADVIRFESWQAHHIHMILIYIALTSSDRNSLVSSIASAFRLVGDEGQPTGVTQPWGDRERFLAGEPTIEVFGLWHP